MKSFVITIEQNQESLTAAKRCIQSANRSGLDCVMHKAITPSDGPETIAESLGIPTTNFKNVYSRYENCLSAFLSHHSLWSLCVTLNEPIIIFEHDAVVISDVPTAAPFNKVMNIGKPSYGKFNTATSIGVSNLFSKPYFPGAHAYMIKPIGAKELIEKAKTHAMPTDVFLHKDTFPWLQEYFPWPVNCWDNFSTIQAERGCLAKHDYDKNTYKLV